MPFSIHGSGWTAPGLGYIWIGLFMGQMFLVMVDAHSKWIEALITSNITAHTTTDKLGQVFAVHRLPDFLVNDNSPTFTSELFKEFMQQNDIHHIRKASFHTASKGFGYSDSEGRPEADDRTRIALIFHVSGLNTASRQRQ